MGYWFLLGLFSFVLLQYMYINNTCVLIRSNVIQHELLHNFFSSAESSVVLCLAQYFNILSETHAFLPCLNNAIQLVFPYSSRFPYTKNNLPSCCTIRTFVQFQPLILASLCVPRISHFRETLPIPRTYTYVYNMAFSCVEMTQVTHYYLQLAKNTHSLD